MREDMKLFFGSAFGVFVWSNGLGDNAESIDSLIIDGEEKRGEERRQGRIDVMISKKSESDGREKERYRRDFLISDF